MRVAILRVILKETPICDKMLHQMITDDEIA